MPYKKCAYNSYVIYIDSSGEESTAVSQYLSRYDSLNIAYRKITRESFGSAWPETMKICDCLKNVGNISGGLDGVLAKSEIINFGTQGISAKVNFTELDKKNSPTLI